MGNKIHRNSLQPGYKLHWYEIKEILGQGGFGITYLAYDANLDKYVAIKEYLPIELAVREGDFSVHPVSENHGKQYTWGLDRFITEARTLSKFKHPNIVSVLSVSEENNTAYMVMEYEQGQSLQEKLSGKKTLEESELLKILIPILGGLDQVHKSGFIHRDIKPDNIFIRADGSPVLLDFGSARQALGEMTKTLTSLVTPGYAPFEQYYSKSDEQGPWTDIYGLGATLYRCTTAIAPIDAVDRSKSILDIAQDMFVPAAEIGKGKYSERFLKAIDHALQFKIKDRPQCIAEWKQEFGITGDMEEIDRLNAFENRTTQPGTRVVRQRPPFRLRLTTVVVFIVLIGSGITFYYWELIDKYVQNLLPEATEPELVHKQPSQEEITPTRQQEEEKAKQQAALERQRQEEEEHRKQENRIVQLLDIAEADFNAGRFVEPPGQNALEGYLNVLKLAPGNSDALLGKDRIFQHFLRLAGVFIQDQEFDEAESTLLVADAIEPNSVKVRLARVRLNDAKARAEKLALEEERIRQEEERLRIAEEQEREAEKEAKRLAKLEKQRQEEEIRKKAEQEQIRAQEEKQRLEEERLAALELKRKEEEEERIRVEKEKKDKYDKHIQLAESYMAEDKFDKAIQEYQIILNSFSGDARALNGIKDAKKYLNTCNEIVGSWYVEPHGISWELREDNSAFGVWLIFSADGNWECLSARERKFVVSWPGCAVCVTETFILTDDGDMLKPIPSTSSTLGKRVVESNKKSIPARSSPLGL
jgi:serine/threonine protein kinase